MRNAREKGGLGMSKKKKTFNSLSIKKQQKGAERNQRGGPKKNIHNKENGTPPKKKGEKKEGSRNYLLEAS